MYSGTLLVKCILDVNCASCGQVCGWHGCSPFYKAIVLPEGHAFCVFFKPASQGRGVSSETPRVMPHCTSGWSLVVASLRTGRHRRITLWSPSTWPSAVTFARHIGDRRFVIAAWKLISLTCYRPISAYHTIIPLGFVSMWLIQLSLCDE